MGAPLSRRRFVRHSVAGAAGLTVLGDPLLARAVRVAPLATDTGFSQGVASGEPGQTAITLWTKLDGLTEARRVGLEVSTDPGFSSILVATDALADPGLNGTVRMRLEGGPFQAGEQYYYRFATGSQNSPIGRFRTARPADSAEPVRIAFFSCQEYIAGYYHAHTDLAARDDIDLVVCLGDYIYEKGFAGTLSATSPVRKDETSPDGDTETLAEYRAKYALYHTDPALRAVRAAFPLVSIWDDHEVEDNYAADLPGGAAKQRRLPFVQRRSNGYAANYEAMPRVRAPGDRDRTHGALSLGAAELILLDTRQFRTNQPCSPKDSAFSGICPPQAYNRPSATLLGATQKAWLKDRLRASRAPWKLIANQVMVMSLDLSAGLPLNTDAWDGYGAERAEIVDHLVKHDIRDVSFMTGDIHTFFAGTVSRTGRKKNSIAGRVDGARATEFVCGAVTSPGVTDRLASGERERRQLSRPLDRLAMQLNPHLAYSNLAYKGYAIATASPDDLRVEFRAVRDTRRGNPACITLAQFVVPRGRAEVQRV